MNYFKIVITAGFAMFSMFFGAGNLVFPLVIGTQSLDNAGYAMLGLMITGVFVPFLGLIGVLLCGGDRSSFFSCIGRVPALCLVFIMLALLGPIGVVPRCIIVGHGAVSSFWPGFSLELFGFLFCLASLLLIWKRNWVVPFIGRYLTPLLLIGIVVICVAGIFFSDRVIESSAFDFGHAFKVGLFDGYQTMDLLAGFFFSTTTVAYIREQLGRNGIEGGSPRGLLRLGFLSSLIGAGLIAIIYIGFVVLGAKYAGHLVEIRPEQMLSIIAGYTLGPIAVLTVSTTIILACLTTAAVLALFFAEFLNEEFCGNKLGGKNAIIFTLALSFCVSLVGFDSLRQWLGLVLQIVYPALIVLTFANIINKIWGIPHFGRWGFWFTAVSSALYYFVFI